MEMDSIIMPEGDQKEVGINGDEEQMNGEVKLKQAVEEILTLFGKSDAAQKNAEKELKEAVEQILSLQNELEFQKEHNEQMFEHQQEYMKTNQQYAQQIDDLIKKLSDIEIMPANCKEKENLTLVLTKCQLDMANNEVQRLRKIVDVQNVELQELGAKTFQIPGLKAYINQYENKVASLEEELKMIKESNDTHNKAVLSNQNDENSSAAPSTSWADRLKNDYRKIARERPKKLSEFMKKNIR